MKKKMIFTWVLTALIVISIESSFAQSGTLDNSFSEDGKVITSTNNYFSSGEAVAIQSNGKIVVAGTEVFHDPDFIEPDNSNFVLVRYKSTGILDNTFGGGDGMVTTDMGGIDNAHAVAIQSDGKIVVAGGRGLGWAKCMFAIARYKVDGTLDSTFDVDGKVFIFFGAEPFSTALALAIQADGKILVAGSASTGTTGPDFAIARFNSNGTIDNTFSSDGEVTINFPGDYADGAKDVVIQADGKIVLAGSSGNFFAVARLNSNGPLDLTFSGDGKAVIDFPSRDQTSYDACRSVAIQSNGKIILAGVSDGKFGLARLNINGALDNTFSGDGRVTTAFGILDGANSVAIHKNGKIVTAGYSKSAANSNLDFAVAQYNINGTPDSSFSADGKVTNGFASGIEDAANSIAIQADGKIVVAGSSSTSNFSNIAVARYYAVAIRQVDPNKLSVTNLDAADKLLPSIRLYPNPVTDILRVEGLNPSASTTISITGQSGIIQKVFVAGNSFSFDVKMLPAGIYYVSVVENNKISNLKFSKQ